MTYKVKDFLPLVTLFIVIVIFTTIGQRGLDQFDTMLAMRHFMASFFLIFGGFKLLNWKGFVEAYRMYDIVAKKSVVYAGVYPLIEISLGIFYILNIYPVHVNIVTLMLMLVGAYGVFIKLMQKEKIMCACLGTVFKIPMTWVTLFEDLLMAVMAGLMLLALV